MTTHEHILATLKLLRNSFIGASVVYSEGSCQNLVAILMHLYPGGEAWTDHDHVVYHYDGHFYDINGEVDTDTLDYHIPATWEEFSNGFDESFNIFRPTNTLPLRNCRDSSDYASYKFLVAKNYPKK